MELKVWVEGIQRIVCGVSDTTTCQDVVYALAHATGKTGRFTLIERWRNSERLLAPHEHPLKILLKWGEHASDVQLILQRSALEPKVEKGLNNQSINPRVNQPIPPGTHQRVSQTAMVDSSSSSRGSPSSPSQSRDIKKSLTFSGAHAANQVDPTEVGANPGLVNSPSYPSQSIFTEPSSTTPPHHLPPTHCNQNPSRSTQGSLNRPPAPPPYELVRGYPPAPPYSNQRRPPPPNPYGPTPPSFGHPNMIGYRPPRELPPYRDPPPPPMPSHPSLVKMVSQGSMKPSPSDKLSGVHFNSDDRNRYKNEKLYSDAQPLQESHSHNKIKRDQPMKTKSHDSSPRSNNSPLKRNNTPEGRKADNRGDINENLIISSNVTINDPSSQKEGSPLKNTKDSSVVKDMIRELSKSSDENNRLDQRTEEVVVDAYYKDLVNLVNQQREKISAQQIDLTKFEAEIAFTEGRWREEESRLEYIKKEIQRLEDVSLDSQESAVPLDQLEDQFNEAKESESKVQESIATIKSKLSDSDNQISQMKQRIRMLQEAILEEQKEQERVKDNFKEEEQDAIFREIEKLQMAVMQATKQAEHAQNLSHQLAQEMTDAEVVLGERRMEIESLREAMKEANMEALAMTPPEDAKALSENRIGNVTSRRMKGSPRQLETAVPTSKNPHGVWV